MILPNVDQFVVAWRLGKVTRTVMGHEKWQLCMATFML